MSIKKRIFWCVLMLVVALPVVGYVAYLHYSVYRTHHPSHDDFKVEFHLDEKARTPWIIPSIAKFCVQAKLIDTAERFPKECHRLKHGERAKLRGYRKIVNAGIFEDIARVALSERKHNVSNFTMEDYVVGRRALKTLEFYCKLGILKELRSGDFDEASRKIDLLTMVAVEYPEGNFCSPKRILLNTCLGLLRERMRLEDKIVEWIEIVSPVDSKTTRLNIDDWKILLPIVKAERSAINKRKSWKPYVNFIVKYKRKTTSARFFQIDGEKSPLKLAMERHGACHRLSQDETKVVQRLVDKYGFETKKETGKTLNISH